MAETIESVLSFWYEEHGMEDWFGKADSFDTAIKQRFETLLRALASDAGLRNSWSETPRGSLAAIMVLDQFPRNIYRDDPRAFATDALARAIGRRAVAVGHHVSPDVPYE